MLNPKIIHAQIEAICYEREARGEPVFELYAADCLHDVPEGSICIYSDIVLDEGSEIPDFKRVATELLMIATDNVDEYIMLPKDGSINQFCLGELDRNWRTAPEDEDPEDYYVLVIKDLNFAFTDSRASAIPKPSVGKQMVETLTS